MASSQVSSLKEKQVLEELWLLYFNQYLFEHGLISEQERNQLRLKIKSRKSSASGNATRPHTT